MLEENVIDTIIINTIKEYFQKENILFENISNSRRDFLYQYFSYKLKYINAIKRKIIKSNEFIDSYNKTNKTEKIRIDALLYKLENGDDVNIYQSKNMYKSHINQYTDVLFNRLNIKHLHLKENGEGDKLLFIRIECNIVYCIDIQKHKIQETDIWLGYHFIKIIENNWSCLLDKIRNKSTYTVCGKNLTEKEFKDLVFNKGYTVPINTGGKGYILINGYRNIIADKYINTFTRNVGENRNLTEEQFKIIIKANIK